MAFSHPSILLSLVLVLCACSSSVSLSEGPARIVVQGSSYQGYRAIDPIPVAKVTTYDSSTNAEKEVFWASINDKEIKRSLLPIQSSQVAVKKQDASGTVGYLTATVTQDAGSYSVIMDYMKYRVDEVVGSSGQFLGNGRVGVGLRIKADVVTQKANINLGSILALGVEAEQGNLSGSISVDVIGIDSEGVTNLIPLTAEIDQTAIQSALQALASVKAKLWEDDVQITPHLVAITDAKQDQEEEIRKQYAGGQ